MLNFSIFEDDQTIGSLANSRVVILRGTVKVSQLFSPNIFDIADWIKTALENNGFSVVAVRMSAAGWIGYSNNVEIELNVFNEFTAEQARVNAILAIEAYRANWGTTKVFSNTTLRVGFDAYRPPGTQPLPSPSPPSDYDQSSADDKDKDSDFLKELGKSLGISAPIALIGGGLLLILILRR